MAFQRISFALSAAWLVVFSIEFVHLKGILDDYKYQERHLYLMRASMLRPSVSRKTAAGEKPQRQKSLEPVAQEKLQTNDQEKHAVKEKPQANKRFKSVAKERTKQQTEKSPQPNVKAVKVKNENNNNNNKKPAVKEVKRQVGQLPEYEGSFSACLLIMDENHRLSEFLAYHYFTMKLRYVVVAVDPHSRTSPHEIFEKWRPYMSIVEWTDKDFIKQNITRKPTDSATDLTNKHRKRQNSFYRKCTKHLRQHNRTWTLYHDVDEFLAFNDNDFSNVRELSLQQNSLWNMVQELTRNETGYEPSFDVKPKWREHFSAGPCVMVPRMAYYAKQSDPETIRKNVPGFLDPERFDTLRWRYRVKNRNFKTLGKALVDVSRLPDSVRYDDDLKWLSGAAGNAHSPFGEALCGKSWLFYERISPFGLHHYIGSWETYNFRQDARDGHLKSYGIWKRKALGKGLKHPPPIRADDEARWWIAPFAKLMGENTTKYLLEDAGLLLPLKNYTLPEKKSLHKTVPEAATPQKTSVK